ncbi:MAG TPA: ChbG/HpnK family deacetylase, partial [Terriglobales bacterium]|nr:ChbG/HpnK family deacetylase [Terriglobales bacterium]
LNTNEAQSLAENTGRFQAGQTPQIAGRQRLAYGCYTFCVRQLIVNADDLGLTPGVNRAIRETHVDGIVTSATLMASGAAFHDAIEIARSEKNLSVGCHVVLVDGAPVSEHSSIQTLLANRSVRPGRFYPRISAVAARSVFGRLDPDQLVNEIVAQITKIQAAGLQVTHLDTHKHTHVFPQILRALVKAARICGVPAIRNPFVSARSLRPQQFSRRPRLWKRYGQVRVLHSFATQFHDKMKRAGLSTPDGVVGVIETGSFDSSLLRQALAGLPDGTWELVCHPGYDDADLRAANTRLLRSRELERQLFTSPELRQFLEEQGIRLISYRQLVKG